MTKREAIVLSAFTGTLLCEFDVTTNMWNHYLVAPYLQTNYQC